MHGQAIGRSGEREPEDHAVTEGVVFDEMRDVKGLENGVGEESVPELADALESQQ